MMGIWDPIPQPELGDNGLSASNKSKNGITDYPLPPFHESNSVV